MSWDGTGDILGLGLAAFVIGLSGAMSPGPYLTVTITRTMRHGRASAALMLVGHALLEAMVLVGFAFGLQAFLSQDAVARTLALLGGAVLLWMGLDLISGAVRAKISLETDTDTQESRFGPVVHGILVSLSNPYWTLWWVTIGIKLASDGLAMGPSGIAAFFIGHQMADVAWYGFVIWAVAKGRHLLSDSVYRTIIGTLGVFLIYLGANFVWDGITSLTA